MTVPQSTQEPLSAALKALCKTDAEMPEALHAASVYTEHGTAVALLDDLDVWSAWIVALDALPGVCMQAQVGRHYSTAEGCVCGCPVMLVTGDYVPSAVAA